MKTLDIANIFRSEAEDLRKAREKAIRIHGTADIKAAGNEVEINVRGFFKRMLPKNLYVTHGHLIYENGVVSPQLDMIIADTANLPSLFTTNDGTEYIPIDSVYACGEIKSTYYKCHNYISAFSEVLSKIKTEMAHEEILNTTYKKNKLDGSELMRDMYLNKDNKILNKIYYFMLFVDKGDFDFSEVKSLFKSTDKSRLPNASILLNEGAIFFGRLGDKSFSSERYPDENTENGYSWYFSPFEPSNKNGSLEGYNLGYLYYSILQHISNSYLQAPNLNKYLSTIMGGQQGSSAEY